MRGNGCGPSPSEGRRAAEGNNTTTKATNPDEAEPILAVRSHQVTVTHPEKNQNLPDTQVSPVPLEPPLDDPPSLARREIDIAKLIEHLDVARRSRGMSSAALAAHMGMSGPVLSRMRRQPDRTQIGAVQGFEMLDFLGACPGDYLRPRAGAAEPPQEGAA